MERRHERRSVLLEVQKSAAVIICFPQFFTDYCARHIDKVIK